jgi:geranylgeranyl diphosphate synthase type II
MGHSKRLIQRQHLIERGLRQALKPIPGTPAELQEAMEYCVFSEGKRFRPLLTLGACEAAGAGASQALPAACAVELIHTYSLVHDDLPAMDNAAQRRGQPSCHRQFGEATAILVGDALLTRAFELLGDRQLPNSLAIVREVAAASGTSGLVCGQVLDLDPALAARSGTAVLEDIATRKTAALITASVIAGALAARASAEQVRALRRYGRSLGLAFQFIDDVHDGDGLVRALGLREVRERGARLIEEARAAIRRFGFRGWLLGELADWLAGTA